MSERRAKKVWSELWRTLDPFINSIIFIILLVLPFFAFIPIILITGLLLEENRVNFVLVSVFILVPATMSLATVELSRLYKEKKDKEELKEIATSFLRAAIGWMLLTTLLIIMDSIRAFANVSREDSMTYLNFNFIPILIWIILVYYISLYILRTAWRLLKLIKFDIGRLFLLDIIRNKKKEQVQKTIKSKP